MEHHKPSSSKIFRSGYRIRKAYRTTFVVMMSYIWFFLKAKIFGKHYADKRIFDVHLRNAERVKKTILHLQGLFIKVGQLLSILTNFLPKAFHEPLEALQNEIPARPFSEIEQQIISELGDAPKNIFAHFDEHPLASASIGQVHRATLKTGEDVAVKVQHINIESIAEVDLRVMERIVRLVAYFFNIKGIEHAYTQVKKMVEEELDFEKEAQSMQVIAANLDSEPALRIPRIFSEYSTHKILVSEYCEGVKISNTEQLKAWNIDQTNLANRLVHAYCKMVFEDGFYHADPHPGNIMVQADGTIIFLDFGAVAHLQPNMRTGFLSLIDGAVKNDDEKIIAALTSMGFISGTKDSDDIAEKIIDALRQFIQNEVQIEGLNFKDIKVNPFETSLFNLVRELGIRGITNTVQVPKEFVLLNRMVTLLLGICNTLDSNMNPINVMQPYLQKYILGEQGNFVKFITDLIKGNLTSAIALPAELQKTIKKIQKGELEIKLSGTAERNRIIYVLGQQFLYTILLIVSLVFTYIFYQYNTTTFRPYTTIAIGLFSFLLLRSMWKNRKLM